MRKGETQVFMTLGFLGLLFLMPLSGDGADLTISNVITGNGDMTLNGAMSATSFSGSGSGLTNLDPTKLSSGTANINISGNAATATTATTATIATTATTANSVAVNAVTAATIAFYGNVAVVAPSGGDYNNPATAMASYGSWCGTPSATTPCLLKIMPGVYDIGGSTVVMQPYIDIEGSGQNVTVITGTVANGSYPLTNGVVTGASNAEIRFLSVKNTGSGILLAAIQNNSASPAMTNVTATASGGNYGFGVSNSSSSPTMTNVTATGSGGDESYGVLNYVSSSPTMTNVTATASGGTNNYGVFNHSSSPTMTNVTATASGGTNNYGVYNYSSSPKMTNVMASASGGTHNYGVSNSSSSPTMTNVTATGSGGSSSNYGVESTTSGTIRINHSVIKGATYTVTNGSGVTTYVGNTQLDGGPVSNSGTLTCAGVYDENYAFYTITCP